ncbi:hypothetical protein AHAS_Ahas13G0243900 [Arachis hypogaea]
MEVSGAVLRNVTCPSFSMHVSFRRRRGGCVTVPMRMREKAVVCCCCGFSDIRGMCSITGTRRRRRREPLC